MKVEIKSMTPVEPNNLAGHLVIGVVDGEEHQLFRRTQMPVSGGTSTPPHVVVREFADDYVLYKAAEKELQKGTNEEGTYRHSGHGGVLRRVKYESVKSLGPNIVEVKGSVDGKDKTQIFTADDFKQRYHQAVALDQPNWFLGAVSDKFTEDKSVGGLQDYLGEFEIQEEPHQAQIVDSKNFAQPHFSQHPLTKSHAQTAEANFEDPRKAIGEPGVDPDDPSEVDRKSQLPVERLKKSRKNAITADQGTGDSGTDKHTAEEESELEKNRGNLPEGEVNASGTMKPDYEA